MNYDELEQKALEVFYKRLNESLTQAGQSPYMIPVEDNGKLALLTEALIFGLARRNYNNFTGHFLGVSEETGRLDEKSVTAIEELIPTITYDFSKDDSELYDSFMAKAHYHRTEEDFIQYKTELKRIGNAYNLYVQACAEFGIQPREIYTSKQSKHAR